MKTTIKSLEYRNFKGVKSQKLEFDPITTTFIGDNGTGKTTSFDAFKYLLFGKNSENKSDFSIKPLDLNNQSEQGSESEVIGVFDIDGLEVVFRRVYREKWVKRQGKSVKEFDGNTEDFFINDVPKSLKEYNDEVDRLFKTSLSRMVTDPMYFNQELEWTKRRGILLEMAGEISNDLVFIQNPDLEPVREVFNEGKSLDDKLSELTAKRKKVKQSIDDIPTRISEVDRSIVQVETSEQDLTARKSEIESEIKAKIDQINNTSELVSSYNVKRGAIISEIGQIESRIQNEERLLISQSNSKKNEISDKIQQLNLEVKHLENSVIIKDESIRSRNTQIEALKGEKEQLRVKYLEVKQREFVVSEADCKCPTCSQSLPQDQIEEKRTSFNQFKASEMERLIKSANEVNERINKFTAELTTLSEEKAALAPKIEDVTKKIAELSNELNLDGAEPVVLDSLELQSLKSKLHAKKTDLEQLKAPETDQSATDSIKAEIQKLQSEINEITGLQQQIKQNQAQYNRKNELESQQSVMLEELGALELQEFNIKQFQEKYIELVEANVNIKFTGVKFKMFETLVNGDRKPTCVCLVNGVPYPDVNTGGQINAGLSIINTLQEYFGVNQPVFIDNRESISVIPQMNCQVINLEKVEGKPILEKK